MFLQDEEGSRNIFGLWCIWSILDFVIIYGHSASSSVWVAVKWNITYKDTMVLKVYLSRTSGNMEVNLEKYYRALPSIIAHVLSFCVQCSEFCVVDLVKCGFCVVDCVIIHCRDRISSLFTDILHQVQFIPYSLNRCNTWNKKDTNTMVVKVYISRTSGNLQVNLEQKISLTMYHSRA